MRRRFHWIPFLFVLLLAAGMLVYGAAFRSMRVYSLIEDEGLTVEVPDTKPEGNVVIAATIGGAYRTPGVDRLYAEDISLWENGVGIPCPT